MPGLGEFDMGLTSAFPRGGWGKFARFVLLWKQAGYQSGRCAVATKLKYEFVCGCKVLKKVLLCQAKGLGNEKQKPDPFL